MWWGMNVKYLQHCLHQSRFSVSVSNCWYFVLFFVSFFSSCYYREKIVSLMLQFHTDIIKKFHLYFQFNCENQCFSSKLHHTPINYSGENVPSVSEQYFKLHWSPTSLSKLFHAPTLLDYVFNELKEEYSHFAIFISSHFWSVLFANSLSVITHLMAC